MLILVPDITVYWDKGVRLASFSYLYMDTLKVSMCKPFQQYLDYLQGLAYIDAIKYRGH